MAEPHVITALAKKRAVRLSAEGRRSTWRLAHFPLQGGFVFGLVGR